MNAHQITVPAVIYAGEGSVEQLRDIIRAERAKTILVFTDKGIRSYGLSARVEAICAEEGTLKVVDDLTAEPAVSDIERVLHEVEGDHPDLVVGLGGGSVMDAAKLASILIGADYTLHDLLVDATIAKKQVRSVMIPTTCGTGSEATCNAIVAIPEESSKKGIVNSCMISDYVILDVTMIAQLPPKIIAATGVDALAHCVECYTSKKATMLSDPYAKEGARKIFHNIRRAFSTAGDLAAKQEMLLGAYYGGIAITGSGTTAVHALSYPLGGKYHIAHGVSNAILFAHVMEFNKDACADRLAELCDAVFPELAGKSVEEKADYIIAEIAAIVRDTEIPTSLEEFGIQPEDIDFLVTAGSQQTRLLVNNCKELSLDDIRYIYKKVL